MRVTYPQQPDSRSDPSPNPWSRPSDSEQQGQTSSPAVDPQPDAYQSTANDPAYQPPTNDPAAYQPSTYDPYQPSAYQQLPAYQQPSAYQASAADGYQASGYQPGAYPATPVYSPYGYPFAPPARPNNSMAVAALIIACLGVVGLCVYGLGGIVGTVGAILGHVARRQIRESGEAGDGLALAGIIVGWIATGVFVIAVSLLTIGIWSAFHSDATVDFMKLMVG